MGSAGHRQLTVSELRAELEDTLCELRKNHHAALVRFNVVLVETDPDF